MCFLGRNRLSFIHSITIKYNFINVVQNVPKFLTKIKAFPVALESPALTPLNRSHQHLIACLQQFHQELISCHEQILSTVNSLSTTDPTIDSLSTAVPIKRQRSTTFTVNSQQQTVSTINGLSITLIINS